MSENTRDAVRDRYREAASQETSCCGSGGSCCCSSESRSADFGYSAAELESLPTGADLALGCGNPTAIANISPGEVVLDLGSGGGIDCFLAAKRTGDEGQVIGVDMTPEMVSRARRAAIRGGFKNVDFRLGEIENIPAADNSVDLVISNCVINLSDNKPRVFAETFRILRPGGRLTISDIILAEELPPEARESMPLLTGCIAGALHKDEMLETIAGAGFQDVRVEEEKPYAKFEHLEALAREAGITEEVTRAIAHAARSMTVTAKKTTSKA